MGRASEPPGNGSSSMSRKIPEWNRRSRFALVREERESGALNRGSRLDEQRIESVMNPICAVSGERRDSHYISAAVPSRKQASLRARMGC